MRTATPTNEVIDINLIIYTIYLYAHFASRIIVQISFNFPTEKLAA